MFPYIGAQKVSYFSAKRHKKQIIMFHEITKNGNQLYWNTVLEIKTCSPNSIFIVHRTTYSSLSKVMALACIVQ